VDSLPCSAGEVEVVHFARCRGLTLVALGLGDADGASVAGLGVEPDAVHFRPAVGAGLGSVKPSPRVTCRPSRSASSIK
jgi:hypothetical protein